MSELAKFIVKYEKSKQRKDEPKFFCHNNIKFYDNVISSEQFYDEHQYEIWDILNEVGDSCGLYALKFLSRKFDAYTVVDNSSFKNFMVWKALEAKCYMMNDFYEEQFNKKARNNEKIL